MRNKISKPKLAGWAIGLSLILVALLAAGAGEEKGAPGIPERKTSEPNKNKYVGAETCKGCHPEAYKVWAGSKHGRSFTTLQTASARMVSNEPNGYAGTPTPKMMAECSPCHARGMEIPRAERGGYHPEDGVQCETCHGPGGHYANEETMKDPARRAEAGLGKLTPEGCLQCHKERPSHAALEKPPFEFEKFWLKIQHGKTRKPGEEKKDRY